ncbi:MAG TPA: DUF3311 domain-containing protein [Selenomonadales bacterium]|nr:DUF3311 domain-containing protein [Selenomonadales bacterium]
MEKKSRIPALLGSIPVFTLVLAIPFVNRLEPFVWGMPFLLWWIVVNVLLTPLWLGLAYRCEKQGKDRSGAPNSGKGGGQA